MILLWEPQIWRIPSGYIEICFWSGFSERSEKFGNVVVCSNRCLDEKKFFTLPRNSEEWASFVWEPLWARRRLSITTIATCLCEAAPAWASTPFNRWERRFGTHPRERRWGRSRCIFAHPNEEGVKQSPFDSIRLMGPVVLGSRGWGVAPRHLNGAV